MTIVKESLRQMPAVRKPQAKFLETLFATILALRGRITFRTLSRYGDYCERTMARQCRRCFDWSDCPQRVITVALDPCSAVSAAQEASFIPKSGKRTFGLGHFVNGCTSRAERGLAISTLAVGDGTRRCAFTLTVAPTPPGEDETVSPQAQEATSVACYLQPLREQRHRLPPQVTYPGVDGYVAQKPYLDEAVRLDLHPMTKRRCDADGRLLSTGPPPKRRGARRKEEGQVHLPDLRRFPSRGPMAEAAHRPLSTAIVWHVTRKRTLRLGVVGNRNAPAQPCSIVLASTELALDGRKVVELYGARFQSELVFRDSKQCTGLSDCPARAEAALDCPCNAALATLNLARTEPRIAQTGASRQVCSMASWQQRPFHERLLDVFIETLALEPSWVKTQPSSDELRSYGAIAA